ncbi:MAG: hypothetical protein R2909_17710 [Gemmatimonadales bacterium]
MTHRHVIPTIAFAVLLGARPVAAQPRAAIDLVTHSEISIDRPAALIWPRILDPSAWKQGASLRHHAGPVGAVGEIFAAVEPADPGKVAFYVENVELEPRRRRTIKLIAPAGATGSGGSLIGYASWTLTESGGRTVVRYDVYSETRLDPAQAAATSAAERLEAERTARATSQARFDRELAALKRLAEGS